MKYVPRPRVAVLTLPTIVLSVLLLVSPPVSGGPIVYQNFAPPFHSVRLTVYNFTGLPSRGHNRLVDRIGTGGRFSALQNSSTLGNATAALTEFARFYSAPYTIGANATRLHVNSSGYGVGKAVVTISTRGPGTQCADSWFSYSVLVGLWDRNTSTWVGNRTVVLSQARLVAACGAGGSTRTVARNLTVGWGFGVNPSPSGVRATDWLQIVTIMIVKTYARTWGTGTWATSVVDLTDHLVRMQGYYS